MIGRLVWAALLLVLAALIAAVQLDREAGRNPALAPLVPEPVRNTAQAQLTMQAIDGADPVAALAAARTLVRRRPVPAEHLTLLAVALAKAGREAEAAATIEQAARRGWREPVAQEAMLGLALDAGDGAETARRFTALFLRQETPDALLTALGLEVFSAGAAAGAARKTMAEIVAGGTRWHAAFLLRGPQTMPPAAFAEIVNRAAAQEARFDCAGLAAATAALARRDATAARLIESGAARTCERPSEGR